MNNRIWFLGLILLVLSSCGPVKKAELAIPTVEIAYSDSAGWEEHYNQGVHFYNEGHYDLALDSFLEASRVSSGAPKRASLTASAMSALGSGDDRFIELMIELQEAEPLKSFSALSETDKSIRIMNSMVFHKE